MYTLYYCVNHLIVFVFIRRDRSFHQKDTVGLKIHKKRKQRSERSVEIEKRHNEQYKNQADIMFCISREIVIRWKPPVKGKLHWREQEKQQRSRGVDIIKEMEGNHPGLGGSSVRARDRPNWRSHAPIGLSGGGAAWLLWIQSLVNIWLIIVHNWKTTLHVMRNL